MFPFPRSIAWLVWFILVGELARCEGISAEKQAPAKTAPAKPVAPQNLFVGFAAAVTLPEVRSENLAKPMALGPVAVTPQTICLAHLKGGATASKTRQRFHLLPVTEEIENRQWRIVVRDVTEEMGGDEIATLEIRDQQVWFTWQPAATTNPLAPYLINCALQLAAGPSTHRVALRKTQRVAPIVVHLNDEAGATFGIPFPPATNQIKVEFVFPKGTFPPHRYVGKGTLAAVEDSAWIEFGTKAKDQGLRLKLETDLSPRGLRIRATPYFHTTLDPRPKKLTTEAVRKAESQLRTTSQTLVAQLKAVRAADDDKDDRKKKNSKKGNGKGSNPLESQLETQLFQVSKALQQLDEVQATQSRLDGKAKFHVRVFATVDDVLLDLVSSQ